MKEKKLEIKIEKEFQVSLYNRPCGKIKICLPTDEDGYLTSLLRSEELIGNESLYYYFGSRENGFRTKTISFEAETWELLQKEINKFIEKLISKLQDIKEKNIELFKAMPKNSSISYFI